MRPFCLLGLMICLWCAAADDDEEPIFFGHAAGLPITYSARATSEGLSEGRDPCAGCVALQGEVRTCLAGWQIIARRLNDIEGRIGAMERYLQETNAMATHALETAQAIATRQMGIAEYQQSRLEGLERRVQETRAVADQALRAAEIIVIQQMRAAMKEQAGPPRNTGRTDGGPAGEGEAKRPKQGEGAT